RRLPSWTCLMVIGSSICPTSGAADDQGSNRAGSSRASSRIVAGTIVTGDIDTRTLLGALQALPRRPETIVVVDTEPLPLWHDRQPREVDAFVPLGSRVIYLRRRSPTLLAAEYSGGPYVLMLAAVIWHEMAHADGLDERHAQEREEDLWRQFVLRRRVDSG